MMSYMLMNKNSRYAFINCVTKKFAILSVKELSKQPNLTIYFFGLKICTCHIKHYDYDDYYSFFSAFDFNSAMDTLIIRPIGFPSL